MKTNTSKKQLVENRLTQLKKQTKSKIKKSNRNTWIETTDKSYYVSVKNGEIEFFWSDIEEFFRTDFQQECF